MNEMDPAGEDQERRKQGLKSYLRTMLEYRIKNMEKTVSKILIRDKKELQNKMPQFLTQDDIQISYSTDGNPNTDLDTWSIPLLCFLTVYLYGQYVPLDEFYLTYDIPCIYFQIDDEPLQISLKPEYNGRIQNLFTHILCEQVKKELLKIIKENKQPLTTELMEKRVDIEKTCKDFLTDNDVEILFPTTGSPNTDLDTWNISVICFVIICVLELSLMDSRIFRFLALYNIWETENILSKDTYNHSLYQLIRNMENRSPSDADIEPEEQSFDTETEESSVDTKSEDESSFYTESDDESSFDTESEYSSYDTETDAKVGLDTEPKEKRSLDTKPKEKSVDAETEESSLDTVTGEKRCLDTEAKEKSCLDTETKESSLDEEKHKLVLDTAVSVIQEFLVPQPIFAEFTKEQYLTHTAVRDMEEAPTTTQKNKEILQHVRAKGKLGYKKFKKFLTNTNQNLLREYLQCVENGMETEHLAEQLRKEADARKRKEEREDALTTERILHTFEQHLALAVKKGKELKDKEDNMQRYKNTRYLHVNERHVTKRPRPPAEFKGVMPSPFRKRSEGDLKMTPFKVIQNHSDSKHLSVVTSNKVFIEHMTGARVDIKHVKIENKSECKPNITPNTLDDIEERLNVQGSTESNRQECCDTIKCVIDQGSAGVESEHVIAAVKQIVVLIDIKDSRATVEDNSCVNITMSCSSSKEMRRLLKTLQGEEFPKCVNNLTEAFEEKYEDSFEVKAKVVTEKIQHVHERLRDQGIIEDKQEQRFCKQHDNKQHLNEYFCPEHDVLCCCECGQTTHRTCPGLRQIMSDPVPEKDKDSFGTSFRNTKGEYRVRTDEKRLCTTIGLSVLPKSDIILIDNVNNKLKKLNLEYKVTSACSLSEPPFDICVVDNDMILVTFGAYVQFMNVKGEFKLEKKLVLPSVCIRLAWHDNSIYYTDGRVIYRCSCEGKDQNEVFTFKENTKKIVCNRLAVSNNGKKVYVAAGEDGLMTIDVQNKTVSTLTDGDLNDCTDVCVAVDDNLLICDFGAQVVYLVTSKGDEILRVVAEKSSGLQHPRSLGFDESDSTMSVGRLGMDFISVFHI